MSQVDPLFLIGVIRDKEKNFLQPDEYARLAENRSAVRDTPYGATLGEELSLASVEAAIEHHLHQELTWIKKYLDNDTVLVFMTARYDAINIVAALQQFKHNSSALTLPSSLGSVSQEALFAGIWDTDLQALASSPWQKVVAEEMAQVPGADWQLSQLLGRMSGHYVGVLNQLAFTPLMRQLAALHAHQVAADAALRFPTAPNLDELHRRLNELGHRSVSAYEWARDAEIMAAISPYRFHVDGYDPVIAYWLAKQIEGQSVRLIVAGTLAGLSKDSLASMVRPYYQPTFV